MFDLAIFFKGFENWKNWHFAFINFSSQVIWEHTWYIFDETTTCDVGNTVNQFFFDEWQSCFDVDTSWFKKNVFKFFAFKFWKNFFTCVISKDTTHEWVTIWVDTTWSKSKKHVTFSYFWAVDDLRFFCDTYRETCQIIVVFTIHTRHFSSFTTNKGCTSLHTTFSNTSNNLLQFSWFIFTSCYVVKEVKGLRTCSDDIINTHCHTVLTDSIMFVVLNSKHEFSTDTICTWDQNRLFDTCFWKVEHTTEATKSSHDTCTLCTGNVFFDTFNNFITCFNIHTRLSVSIFICHFIYSFSFFEKECDVFLDEPSFYLKILVRSLALTP